MHVDGFRFDLASALARSMHDVDMLSGFLTTIQQDPLLSRVKLIAEPWDVGQGGYQVGEFPPLWSEWNDKYRNTLRDFWRGQAHGVREVSFRLAGSSDLYGDDGRRPYASINFVTAHDGFTLRDLVSYDHKHNEANGEGNRDGNDDNRSWNHGVEGETDDPDVLVHRRRSLRNFLGTLLLANGVPMLAAGDEMGRTQGGNNNAYCQDNAVSWVDWDLAAWQKDLQEWARALLELRRDHPVFRHTHFWSGQRVTPEGPRDLTWLRPDGAELTAADWWSPTQETVGLYFAGDGLRQRDAHGRQLVDESFLLLLHCGPEDRPFLLPGHPYGERWQRLLDSRDEHPGDGSLHDAGEFHVLAPRSMALFQAVPGDPDDPAHSP